MFDYVYQTVSAVKRYLLYVEICIISLLMWVFFVFYKGREKWDTVRKTHPSLPKLPGQQLGLDLEIKKKKKKESEMQWWAECWK